MELERFFTEAVVVLGVAVVVVVASARLRVPPMIGLLVTGLLIGPSGLAVVASVERVELFAEIGVVLLLFVIGLELSLERLKDLRRPFLLGGSLQALLTIGAVTGTALALGVAFPNALFLGWAATLSSTAVVLKLYADRREGETPQGEAVLGTLLFQDFLVVPMIVLTPVLAGQVAATPGELALRFTGALAAVAAVFVAARYLMPWMLHHLVTVRVREALVLGALTTCLAMAWLTHALGFSLALGAFLAGILVSESEYSHQVIADIGPFRDVFASVFFISIGMLVDLEAVLARPLAVLAVALGIILVKALAAGVAVAVTGYAVRIAVIAGLGLAQMGEFSFLLMEVGRTGGLLGEGRFQLLLAAAVLTLFATPALVAVAPRLGARMAALVGRLEAPVAEAADRLAGHVVVVGLGFGGGLLVRVLDEARIPYVALELNAETVRRERRRGRRAIYGDATRREVLEHAGVAEARAVVFAISDPGALVGAVHLVRTLNPSAEVVVRSRSVGQIDALRAAGASQVVAEELEASLVVFSRVLEAFHVPRNVIRAQLQALRTEGYELLRAPEPGGAVSQVVLDALAAGTTDLFRLGNTSPAAGKSLQQLDLRRETGASVIAVVRDGKSYPNPDPDVVLQPGDDLVLVGSHAEIDRAWRVLDVAG